MEVWERLGTFVYDDGAAECKNCQLRPLTDYLNQGYYLGQAQPLSELREGRGVWLSSPLNQMYEGYWKNDQFSGKGRLISQESGDAYMGQFRQGKRHGPGFLTLNDQGEYTG